MKAFILKQLGYILGGSVVIAMVMTMFFGIGYGVSKLFTSFTPGECTVSFLLVAILFVLGFMAEPKVNSKK